MKMCGGSGKNATIPPREYIPHSFVVDDIKCGKCLKIFETGNDVSSVLKLRSARDQLISFIESESSKNI